ncbi:AMP-binding protein, partial [Pseudonocardia pini]|uniref:AMP-binding protein n=1 Tax=Pseudonocardia pini TaxID=2758030 RepID=UPI0015F058AA
MTESVYVEPDTGESSTADAPAGGAAVGVRDRLAELLRAAPDDAEAIEHDGVWWTWGRVRSCAAALDEALTAAGVGVDGRVGIVLENRPEFVAAVASVLAAGRCVVTLSPLQPAA